MFGLGVGELLIIGAGVVLLFGSKKIPELGSGLAKGIKNFQKGISGQDEEQKTQVEEKKETTPLE